MKLAAVVIKTLKESLRDWKVLALALVFAPFFMFLMYLFYGTEATTYRVGVYDRDGGGASSALIETISGAGSFEITYFGGLEAMKEAVTDGTVALGLEVPPDYSEKLDAFKSGGSDTAVVTLYGSMGSAGYTYSAVYTADAVLRQGLETAKLTLPTDFKEIFLEKKMIAGGFDAYVPGGVALAVLLLIFTATAAIVRENDKKTLVRLKLSRVGAFSFLAGVGIVQAVVGVLAIVLAYVTALALGYQSVGRFGAVCAVGFVSSMSMVAVSLLLASFLNTIFDVLTVGCFPFFILMFFSGSMFPLPKAPLVTIFGHPAGLSDLLPLTHTVNAFNKILNFGMGIDGVIYELAAVLILTASYLTAGILLYSRRKLSKA